jgi:asparagine synthase (glutamine-hydrolysing)
MCGITAIICCKGKSISPKHLKKMNDVLSHRGPDDEGFVLFDNSMNDILKCYGSNTPDEVKNHPSPYTTQLFDINGVTEEIRIGLGHRRLSVIDLTPAGHEPMSYGDNNYWIIFNGEIYNHQVLREELIKLGYKFTSKTDTEVILASYAEWGITCLEKFNGMWAFVLLDKKQKKIFLARDRFGVKPLYYWSSPEGFLALASEIKAFTVLPGWKATLEKEMAFDFLKWGITDHTNRTLFKDVFQLRPSEAAVIDLNQSNDLIIPYRYYSIHPKELMNNLDEAGEKFKSLLEDSVKLRMISDVPIGSCLSGGLDSSSIVCVMNKLLMEKGEENRQSTFSAYSEEKKTDESEYIEEVVKTKTIDSHITYPDIRGLEAEIENLVWHQDEPFNTTSPYAQWCVFNLAKKNKVVVMLDGQGADEILAGYHNYFSTNLLELLLKGRILRYSREIKAVHYIYGYPYIKTFKEMLDILLNDKFRDFLRRIFRLSKKEEWFNPILLGTNGSKIVLEQLRKNKSIKQLELAEISYISLPKLLRFEDRNSMAHSIESRVPFLDFRLVEFVISLPEDFLIKDGITKQVLRKAMIGILPDKIRNRVTKLGFATPEEYWIRQHPEFFLSLMKEAIESSRGIIKGQNLEYLRKMVDGKIDFSTHAWRSISFGLWMKKFSVAVE